jgi:hypothetical protein
MEMQYEAPLTLTHPSRDRMQPFVLARECNDHIIFLLLIVRCQGSTLATAGSPFKVGVLKEAFDGLAYQGSVAFDVAFDAAFLE